MKPAERREGSSRSPQSEGIRNARPDGRKAPGRLGAAAVWLSAVLGALVVIGVASEIVAARTTRPFRSEAGFRGRVVDLVAATRGVGRRFEEIRTGGYPRRRITWLARSASRLEAGGICGDAAVALGAVFDQAGQPFRILQLNVGPTGAAHVVVEARAADGRWILLDPLMSRAIADRRSGQPLTLEEARRLAGEDRAALDPEYVDGAFSLLAPSRRTNWSRLGPLRAVLEPFGGRRRFEETSLRALLIEPGGEIATLAGLGLVVLAALRMSSRSRGLPPAGGPRGADGARGIAGRPEPSDGRRPGA